MKSHQFINEVSFSQSLPYTSTKDIINKDSKIYTYRSQVSEKEKLRLYIELNNLALHIWFQINNKFTMTNSYNSIVVLSTVKKIIDDNLPKIMSDNPSIRKVIFSGNNWDTSRIKFYNNRLVPYMSKLLGPEFEVTIKPSPSELETVYTWVRKEKLNEILKLSHYDSSYIIDGANERFGGSQVQDWKLLSGYKDLYYYIGVEDKTYYVNIATKVGDMYGYDIIAVLSMYRVNDVIETVYGSNIYEVGSIGIDKSFRGYGLSRKLYQLALYPPSKGGTGFVTVLFAGDQQTVPGRFMWKNLFEMPNISVTGTATVLADDSLNSNSVVDKLDKLFSMSGGSYLGNTLDKRFYMYEFPVRVAPNKSELTQLLRGTPFKIYGETNTGLMARYYNESE